MIVLGVVLLVIGYVAHIAILRTVGIIPVASPKWPVFGVAYMRATGRRPGPGPAGTVSLCRGGRLRLEMVVQDLSRRGKVTSRRTRRSAAAMGMATRAPIMPRRVPPTRTATTVTTPGTWTALPMIRGTSR
jgi:hypothetical protein